MKIKLLTSILLLGLLTSCGTPVTTTNPPPPVPAITKIANALSNIATVTGTFQTSVISLGNSGALSVATTKSILTICSQVDTLVSQASAIIRTQQASATPTQLLPLLNPILQAFSVDLANSNFADIKDQNTKNEIQVGLLAIQTAVSVIQITLN